MTTRLLTIASSAAIALTSTAAQAATSAGGDTLTAYTILAGMVAIAVLLGISAYSSERRKH